MKRRDLLNGLAIAATAGPFMARDALAQETERSNPRETASVEGCVALVTGSNRGVGLGFVEILLERGAKRVYATARNPDNLPAVVALDPDRVVPLQLDVNNNEHRHAAAAAAKDVTWVINNAAYPGSRVPEERRIRSASTLDDSKLVMETNCWSPAELARLFIPIILNNGGGAIANVLSAASWFCLPEYSSYSLSKAAMMMMTNGLRAELDRDPVLVASVFTGGVDTRASPAGSNGGISPKEHARQVFDAMAQGDTDVYAAGSKGMRDAINADPEAFERGRIKRFYESPLTIRNHT
ncbi:MAG: SDR family NAD(P)-dependent oxidoreductase [Alphaproteobacteria bacterium]|nr:SDR family NAD(P)-dependent oxidoreductase [Alphaproteobacteria bacterium]